MDMTPVEQRPVQVEDAIQALRLAQPTQRLFIYLCKKDQQWPGKPIFERFEVIQQQVNISDLDFANALEELLAHRIATFSCAEDTSLHTTHIANRLRRKYIHGVLEEQRKLNVALVQFSWPNTILAVRAVWQRELGQEDQPESAMTGSVEVAASTPEAAASGGSTSYRLVFQDGKPTRVAEGDAPPPEPEPDVQSEMEPEKAQIGTRKAGWIYVLKAGRNYKIGKTITLNQRMAQLRIQLPEKPEIVHTIESNDIDWVERHWHKHFASKRRNGEWFRLTPDDVDELKAIKRMDVER